MILIEKLIIRRRHYIFSAVLWKFITSNTRNRNSKIELSDQKGPFIVLAFCLHDHLTFFFQVIVSSKMSNLIVWSLVANVFAIGHWFAADLSHIKELFCPPVSCEQHHMESALCWCVPELLLGLDHPAVETGPPLPLVRLHLHPASCVWHQVGPEVGHSLWSC